MDDAKMAMTICVAQASTEDQDNWHQARSSAVRVMTKAADELGCGCEECQGCADGRVNCNQGLQCLGGE